MAISDQRDLEAQSRPGVAADIAKLSGVDITRGAITEPSTPRPSSSIKSHANASTGSPSARVTLRSASEALADSSEASLGASTDEERNIFDFVDALEDEQPAAEPWLVEMTRLRRLHFLHINKRLAACKKKILETRRATDRDMEELGALFNEQGTSKSFQVCRRPQLRLTLSGCCPRLPADTVT